MYYQCICMYIDVYACTIDVYACICMYYQCICMQIDVDGIPIQEGKEDDLQMLQQIGENIVYMMEGEQSKRGPQSYASKYTELLKQSQIQFSKIEESIESELLKQNQRQHSPIPLHLTSNEHTLHTTLEQTKFNYKQTLPQSTNETQNEENNTLYASSYDGRFDFLREKESNVTNGQPPSFHTKQQNHRQDPYLTEDTHFTPQPHYPTQSKPHFQAYPYAPQDTHQYGTQHPDKYAPQPPKPQIPRYTAEMGKYPHQVSEESKYTPTRHPYCTEEYTADIPHTLKRMRTIGVGAHSFVYLVQERGTGALYAQKSIKKTHLCQEDVLNEIKILFFFHHPNLIQLYHIYSDQDYMHLILEYAEQSLFGLKTRFKCFKEKEIIEVLKQLLRGVQHLHSHGIVHADIKLENILIGNGTIKLADFGYAHKAHSTHKDIVGTLDYLAPEYVIGDDSGVKRDMWAVGILAYELVIVQGPFHGLSEGEKWGRLIKKGSFPYCQQLQAEKNKLGITYEKVDDVVRHTLCDQHERWTAKQLLELPIFK